MLGTFLLLGALAQSPADTTALEVTFSATGGSVTGRGLFTAGPGGGMFRVIVLSGGVADTSFVTVAQAADSPMVAAIPPESSRTPVRVSSSNSSVTHRGIPFGPFGAWDATGPKPHTEIFSGSIGSTNQKNVIGQIDMARSKHLRMILTLTGGAHSNYMTNGVFDVSKWEARMDAYNTPEIQEAIAKGVADGTIIGNSVMDEPHVSGRGFDGNTWGPPGTMTKARVDSLCAYVKAIFPTLPVGVVHRHDVFQPNNSYSVCDFIVSQYGERAGSVTDFRDAGLAMAKRNGMTIAFSMNIINGGTEDRDGAWDCAGLGSNGVGGRKPKCRMTADQIRNYGLTLGSAGCALTLWKYDPDFMARSDNQFAFKAVTDSLARLPDKPCTRTTSPRTSAATNP